MWIFITGRKNNEIKNNNKYDRGNYGETNAQENKSYCQSGTLNIFDKTNIGIVKECEKNNNNDPKDATFSRIPEKNHPICARAKIKIALWRLKWVIKHGRLSKEKKYYDTNNIEISKQKYMKNKSLWCEKVNYINKKKWNYLLKW